MYRIHRAVHWASLDAYIRSLGPAGWWRMDQGVTVTGAGISQVDDLSGNARYLLDPGTTRPIYLPFTGTRYLYLPGVAGNYASTPDSAANSITGDIDIRVRVALDDYTSSGQMLVSKHDGGTNRCYYLSNNFDGTLGFSYTTNGSDSTGRIAASSVAHGVVDKTETWFRATYASATGKVNFYKSTDGASWTVIGTEQTITSGAIFDSATRQVEVGSYANGALPSAGKIYRAIIKNGIDGTTVVDFNPADASDGASSFASSATGETWTVNTSGALPAQIVGRASALFNSTSHYLKCNAFTLTQPACVLWVGKQAAWTSGDYLFDIGSAAGGAAVIQQGVTPELRMFAGISLSRTQAAIGSIVVVASVFNGASSLFGINGANTTGNSGANALGNFSVGAASNGVGSSASQVYETVIFPIAPSTAQLDRLVAGLMARHGVA